MMIIRKLLFYERPFFLQGKPVDYKACQAYYPSWTCWSATSSPSVTEVNKASVHKNEAVGLPGSWRPLWPLEAHSPCACGCIYIVNSRRIVDITSGSECSTLPITWTVKVCTPHFMNIERFSVLFFVLFLFTYFGLVLHHQCLFTKKKSVQKTL